MAANPSAHPIEASAVTTLEPKSGGAEYDIVLKPLSHPELDDICIEDELFAVGRNERPFDSYPPEIVADLSRRHARIFCEYGAVFIADLDSKNGTTVNGVDIQQKISRLNDGDEICFGRSLSWRVHLGRSGRTERGAPRVAALTLMPHDPAAGLQPLVISRFPFLVSKADDAFARYKEAFPHQVHYLSRRHAHIFLKGGTPFVEDLGSTNGTFVNERRLDEHAVALKDGDTLAFGGHHFVYQVVLQAPEVTLDPTVTRVGPAAAPAAAIARALPPEVAEKTTFVAAADSFLDIFCIDPSVPGEADAPDGEPPEAEAARADEGGPRRGRRATLLAEFRKAFHGESRSARGSNRRWWLAALAALLAVAFAAWWSGHEGRYLKQLMADGDYAQASQAAAEALAERPGDVGLQSLATEALLKAHLPQWLAAQKAGNFDEGSRVLARMSQQGAGNPELQPLLRELSWLGGLQAFAARRPQADAPLRIFSDEETIKSLLAWWDRDTAAHQRALARIAAHVPEFSGPYAAALSYLRGLQAENAVYLAAIERLKSGIANELARGRPEAVSGLLDEAAQKYPRIQGLDEIRRDLAQYLPLADALRERRLGALAAAAERARFATPPFQERMRQLAARELPPPDLMRDYAAVTAAWRRGEAQQALSALQAMQKSGPWRDGVAQDAARRQALLARYEAALKGRDARGQEERLLAFYGSADPLQDAWFIERLGAELAARREPVLRAAQQRIARAESLWSEYQVNGGIEQGQRIEPGVSTRFRSQAGLLSAAAEAQRQGLRVYRQLQADYPAQWNQLQRDIESELALQRRALIDARAGTLAPALVKTKLDMLGGGDER
ncbi:FHA domain-containing protein [Noviherbaspirillum aridicola]|uniref:FHA domain-containing protein n=1 Tax=Noviherbaspirillum aridicola TaxID=2849687 RepID=A0ABQ4Q8Y6_9BURK|nr:FHA domain-containing protein [Noviherbaspirillum aridicola]GIZ53671.1 hypothetical protein NCCP691_36850 [Noviherbaspirillum aridicola]